MYRAVGTIFSRGCIFSDQCLAFFVEIAHRLAKYWTLLLRFTVLEHDPTYRAIILAWRVTLRTFLSGPSGDLLRGLGG